MGLLLLLDRWDVIGIDESGADLVIGGKPQRYRRRALPASAISPWELSTTLNGQTRCHLIARAAALSTRPAVCDHPEFGRICP